MRPIALALASLVLCVAVAFAAERRFGAELSVKEVTKIADILAGPDAFNDKRVLVEGTIVDVCKKRGCWIKIAEEGAKAPLLFKVVDGVIAFPVEVKGLKVRAQGVISVTKAEPAPADGHKDGEEHKDKDGKACDSCASVIMLRGEGAVVGETATR